MAHEGTLGNQWHNPASMYCGGDGLTLNGPDSNGDISWSMSAASYKQYKNSFADPLWIAVGVVLDGEVIMGGAHKGISFNSNTPAGTLIWSGSASGSRNLDSGNHSIYGVISCYDFYANPTSCSFGCMNVQITNAINFTVTKATKPGKPSPSLSYPTQTVNQGSNHKGTASWTDNCFNGSTATKGHYVYSFKMRTNSSSTWRDINNGTRSNGNSFSFDNPYPMSPGNQCKIAVYAHTSQGLDGDTGEATVTYPNLSKSASVGIASTSSDRNMYVRGNFEVKATISGLACNVDLASSRYRWVIRFYDSANHTRTVVDTNNSNSSVTAAISSPYATLGSRHGDTLYAEVKVYLRYNTYNYTGTSQYSTTVAESLIATKNVTIGKLVDFYVKIINSSMDKWAKVWVINSAHPNGQLIPYDKFDVI